ncbi:MAG: hypothetical protein R3345_02170 [Fulvivirga sp.]|nr:hypothetical protein [Fulvivirga sp.]
MTGVHFNAMRVGKKYFLVNYGERFEFEVTQRLSEDDFVVKDINTLETYKLSEFTAYGKGEDFEVREL